MQRFGWKSGEETDVMEATKDKRKANVRCGGEDGGEGQRKVEGKRKRRRVERLTDGRDNKNAVSQLRTGR